MNYVIATLERKSSKRLGYVNLLKVYFEREKEVLIKSKKDDTTCMKEGSHGQNNAESEKQKNKEGNSLN